MIELKAALESLKRHWLKIALITILCAAIGLAYSKGSSAQTSDDGEYAAEATIYVTAYAQDTIGDYNFSYSDDKLISDSRRIVVSNEVAGVIRSKYDGKVTISSPQWKGASDVSTTVYTRFIFVDAVAGDKQTALDAANEAASLAADIISDTIPNATVENVGDAAIREMGKDAADFGSDALDGTDEFEALNHQEATNGKGTKAIVILAVLGLFGSACIFVLRDLFSRKVRSANDVVRIFDIPVLGTLSNSNDAIRIGDTVKVVMQEKGLNTLAIVSPTAGDKPDKVAGLLAEGSGIAPCAVSAKEDEHACSKIAQCDAVVIVVKENVAASAANRLMVETLVSANAKVMGAVFVPAKSQVVE